MSCHDSGQSLGYSFVGHVGCWSIPPDVERTPCSTSLTRWSYALSLFFFLALSEGSILVTA